MVIKWSTRNVPSAQPSYYWRSATECFGPDGVHFRLVFERDPLHLRIRGYRIFGRVIFKREQQFWYALIIYSSVLPSSSYTLFTFRLISLLFYLFVFFNSRSLHSFAVVNVDFSLLYKDFKLQSVLDRIKEYGHNWESRVECMVDTRIPKQSFEMCIRDSLGSNGTTKQ